MSDVDLQYDDNYCLLKISEGDEQFFNLIFEKYRNRLFTYLFKITKSKETAEEIVLDVFLKLLHGREGFDKIIENNYTKDDIWDPSDGMTSPVETRVTHLVDSKISARALKEWNNSLQPLSLEDLDEIGKKFPEILVE